MAKAFRVMDSYVNCVNHADCKIYSLLKTFQGGKWALSNNLELQVVTKKNISYFIPH